MGAAMTYHALRVGRKWRGKQRNHVWNELQKNDYNQLKKDEG